MAFEFLLDLHCEVKAAIPTEELVGLVKSRRQVDAALALARRSGDTRQPSEFRIKHRLVTPSGTEDRSVTAQELLDNSAKVDTYAHHCTGCVANLSGRP